MVAYVNNIRYSNKLYVIGQSAVRYLSPLCKDMVILQRVDGGGVDMISNHK